MSTGFGTGTCLTLDLCEPYALSLCEFWWLVKGKRIDHNSWGYVKLPLNYQVARTTIQKS